MAIVTPAQEGYETLIARARECLEARDLEGADACARSAVGIDPGAPAAFHLLGVIREARSQRLDAQRFYRAALALDPDFSPAARQLHRSVQSPSERSTSLWEPVHQPASRTSAAWHRTEAEDQ